MQVPIKDIKRKKRIRMELGNIEQLAESMKKLGQISPIIISKSNVLIAGGRRLEAARRLGWQTINAVIADVTDPLALLEYEIEENTQRSPLSVDELAEASRRLYKLLHPGFFRRLFRSIGNFFKRIFGKKERF
ncbi:chromosome partitioning protein ParB [Spirochaetia bacterium]|nr:chromosome partitioning protein ParB [Spirochaetia bacterium]